jgi:hypothetical protein
LCRYPTLLENELNPDEGQFLASAHKLFYDPNFFRAVDCGTSGPLNVYPLMLPAILGLTPDFASSRVMVLAIILLSTLLLYRSIALIASEEVARISVLPFIGAFAVFKDIELIHYSSEHVPLLLISIALYLSVRVLRRPAEYRVSVFLLGLLVCAAFFTKMQSVPIVAGMAAVTLACVYATGHARKVWEPVVLIIAGAAPLMLLNTALCVAAGVWADFWMSYIRANLTYGNVEGGFVTNLRGFIQYVLMPNEVRFFLFTVLAIGAAYLVERMRRHMRSDHSTFVELAAVAGSIAAAVLLPPLDRFTIYAYLGVVLIYLVPVFLVLRYIRGPIGADPLGWFGLLALVSVAAALFSVYKAHHLFVHYLLLLFLPLSTMVAWMLIRQSGTAFLTLTLTFVVAYQSCLWSFQDDHVFKNAARVIRPPEGRFIRSVTRPGDQIFVWGWTVRPYLASGRVSATRDTNVSNCFRSYNVMASPPVFLPTPASKEVAAYNEKRILQDLRANRPEVFIDAVGPTSWFLTDRKYFGFEQFPDINAFVTANYRFVADLYQQRYYLRRDVALRGQSSDAGKEERE